MRILVISGYWPSNANPISGIFVEQQVEEYVRQGHDIVVIAPVGFGRPKTRRPLRLQHRGAEVFSPRYLTIPGISRLPPRLRAMALSWTITNYARATLSALERLNIGENIDVVHVHGVVFAGLALPLIRKKLLQPIILTIHGDDRLLAPLQAYNPIKHSLSGMWKCVSRIALVGATLKSYAHCLRAPEEKLIIIPNGTRLPTNMGEKFHKSGSDNKKIRLVSISNLNRTKGIHFNIEAVRKLNKLLSDKKVCYTIIGDGVEKSRLEKLVKTYALGESVRFVGRLPYDPTMELLGQADIFSLPSYVEAFGIVYIEAMARGLPVIGCWGTGAEEIITDGETGILVKQQDAVDLARALERLVRDGDLRRRMGRNAKHSAKQFSWAANVCNYIAMFEEIQRPL